MALAGAVLGISTFLGISGHTSYLKAKDLIIHIRSYKSELSGSRYVNREIFITLAKLTSSSRFTPSSINNFRYSQFDSFEPATLFHTVAPLLQNSNF